MAIDQRTISASRYNILAGRINAILGVGSGNKGYGQAVSSFQISNSESVRASHMNALHTDMVKAREHQINDTPTTIATVTNTDVIAGDRAYPEQRNPYTDDLVSNAAVLEQAIVSYENLMTDIENDKFEIAIPDQSSIVASGANSTRTTAWGGTGSPQTITHKFEIVFANDNQLRYFFNAGGQVRFGFTITGFTNTKGGDWNAMFGAIGTSVLNNEGFNDEFNVGIIQDPTNPINYTSTSLRLYEKSGSGAYAENSLTIDARKSGTGKIEITINLNDTDQGSGGADEQVDGTLTSTFEFLTADGAVTVNSPSANLITKFADI